MNPLGWVFGPRHQSGTALLGVVLILSMIAAAALWLATSTRHELLGARSNAGTDVARELRTAAFTHAAAVATDGSCAGSVSVANVELGSHSYGFALTADNERTHQIFLPTHDTYIREDKPEQTNGSQADLHSKLKKDKQQAALIRFDLSAIPAGETVQSARLWLYVVKKDSVAPLDIHENTSLFREGEATWNSVGTDYEPSPIASLQPSASDGHWLNVPIAGVVQRWINAPLSNFGLRLLATSNGIESKVTSKEYATATKRPYLEVVFSAKSNHIANVTLLTELSGGPPLAPLNRSMPLLQGAQILRLQPGSEGEDAWYNSLNRGFDAELQVANDGRRAALRFSVEQIPRGARVLDAQLELVTTQLSHSGSIDVAAYTDKWLEEVITDVEARWGVAWKTPGGDLDLARQHRAKTVAKNRILRLPVKETVQHWVNGASNFGLQLSSETADLRFGSSDNPSPKLRPRLVVRYACPCGKTCETGSKQKSKMLFIVSDQNALSDEESLRYDTFRSWGYEVSLLSASRFRLFYLLALIGKDVVYVSNAIGSEDVSALADITVGVVSEHPAIVDEIGLAQGHTFKTSDSVSVDTVGHSITAAYPPGDLVLGDQPLGLAYYTGLAEGSQNLASLSGSPTLLTLETGAVNSNGTSAESNRVALPFGDKMAWGQHTADTLLMIKESLAWVISGNSVVSYCNADFAPNAIERSVAVGGLGLSDVAWVPEGASLGGVMASAGGGWVTVDSVDKKLRLLDADGTELAAQSPPTNDPSGIAYIESGAEAGNWVYTDLAGGQLVIMRPNGTRTQAYDTSNAGIAAPSGVTFIAATPESAYDNHFAVVDLSTGKIVIYNQTGVEKHSVVVAVTEQPSGIIHLPGTDKLLVSYAHVRRVIDFGGNEIRSYTGGGPGSASGTAIHGITCQHVMADSTNSRLQFLKTVTAPFAHWLLDENGGTQAIDEVTGREGDLTSTSWDVSGVSGGGLGFNGSSSEMRVAHDSAFAIDRDFTVAAWIHPRLVDGPQGVVSNSSYFELSLREDELALIATATNEQLALSSGAGIKASQWAHVAATVDSSQLATLYVNGVVVGTQVFSESSLTSTDDLLVGVDQDNNHFDGVVDDVRIYNQVLGAGFIQGIHSSTEPSGNSDPYCKVASDDFESQNWDGSTGNLPWSGGWVEINESTNPTAGDEVVTNPFGWVAQIRDNDGGGEGIERALDLAFFSSATLSFDYWRGALEADDFVMVLYSSDNGANWTELQRLSGPGTDTISGPPRQSSLTLPSPLGVASKIRFLTWSGMGGSDRVYFDNLSITACY